MSWSKTPRGAWGHPGANSFDGFGGEVGDGLEGEGAEFDGGVAFLEEAQGPLIDEQGAGAASIVEGEARAVGWVGVMGFFFVAHHGEGLVFEAPPADVRPTCRFEAAFGAVFILQAMREDFKLQWADGGQQRCFHGGVQHFKLAGDAFAQELFEAEVELFVVARLGVVEPGEDFGGELGDFVEDDGAIVGEGVANAEKVIADEANDITGDGGVDGFALVAEEFGGVTEANALAGLSVDDEHIALEGA